MAKKAKKPIRTPQGQTSKDASQKAKPKRTPKPNGRKPMAPVKRTKTEDGTRRGVPNVKYDQVDAHATRCVACGSTRRTKYHRSYTKYLPHDRDGKPVTHIIYRHCQCGDCGQARIDRVYENQPEWPQDEYRDLPDEEDSGSDAAAA